MKVLVTGLAGMIGSYLLRGLIKENIEVIGIDNLSRGKIENISNLEGFDVDNKFLSTDLSNRQEAEKDISSIGEIDVVIHLADIVAGLGYVFNHEYEIFKQNNLINSNIVSISKNIKPKKFIYVGTACSFPKSLQTGINAVMSEKLLFPAEPESAYGWSKLIGSLEMKYAFSGTDISYTTLILHNVYGRYTDFSIESGQVIPSLIHKCLMLNENDSLKVWGNGKQSRSFLHASDVDIAIRKIIRYEKDLPEYVQIGPNEGTSISELARLILFVLGNPNEPIFDTSKPMGDYGRACDYSLAKDLFNWVPTIALDEGVKDLADWIESRIEK